MTVLQHKGIVWLFHELVFSGIVILSCCGVHVHFVVVVNGNKSSNFADTSLVTNDYYLCVGTSF